MANTRMDEIPLGDKMEHITIEDDDEGGLIYDEGVSDTDYEESVLFMELLSIMRNSMRSCLKHH